MAIKIDMLRCFQAVANHGSLAAAATVLGRTPSAISMMLKQFEEHIGAPLFETARKARLTPLGALILTEAQRELGHFDRTIQAIEGLSQAKLGSVRLAVTPSVAQTVLPPVLQRFMQDHPKVRIDLRDMDSTAVADELIHDRADIGLASIASLPGFERQILFSDAFGVVCRADHPLSQNWHDLSWADLQGVDFIVNGLCAQISDEAFQPVLDAARLTVRNTASLLGLVQAGMGLTLLPRLAVLPGFNDLCFLPLRDTTVRRTVWMVTPPRQMVPPAVRAFAEVLRRLRINDRSSVDGSGTGIGKLGHMVKDTDAETSADADADADAGMR
ncbi:MAG: LysR family transcriptional regulator [Paracoccaceae bacterium]|jgi:DNA-binding transcriptional LysR family regulator|tara:strand:- start:156 stop:1142 length:987 start_codon:yes stop_codon:yes gene_type:complete